MRWGAFFLGVLVLIMIGFLFVYFFIPINTINFNPINSNSDSVTKNSNFSLDSNLEGIQFYPNMRYQSNKISYRIYDVCPLKRKNDMQEAFEIISNLTILEFYPVLYGEEISITCSNENVVSGDLFVGGEGGVTNVTVIGDYNLIFNGKVLLIRDSSCPRPNIAIHELLHALGFNHSENSRNIMYSTSNCDQTIGEDIPNFINQIYSLKADADLTFENVSAVMNGKYLDANLSIRNIGFKDAPPFSIIISADGKVIDELEVSALKIGYGNKLSLTNLWINKVSINEIEFTISTNYTEIDKTNNFVILSVKK